MDAGIGAGVADHDLAEQPAQFLRFARLPRTPLIDEAGAEFFRRRQLAGLEVGDQVVEFLERILHGRGGEQEQKLARQRIDRLPCL